MLIGLTFAILFSSPAFPTASNECRKLFSSKENVASQMDLKLTAESKQFWIDIGLEIIAAIEYDFQRPVNKKLYAEAIQRGHPTIDFYRSLGFDVQFDGTIKAPSPLILLSKLKSEIQRLNKTLQESGADFQISPKIFLDLKHSMLDQQQKVILDLLQEFSAPGFRLMPRGNILRSESFMKFVSTGGFPIGGIENASGPNRTIIDLEKDNPSIYNTDNRASISEFLHDLSHLSAFVRQPEFAKAYFRVFRHQLYRLERLDSVKAKELFNEITRTGSPEWRRNFYFSESSWVTYKNYLTELDKLPTLVHLMKINSENSRQFSGAIEQTDKSTLLIELRNLRNNWWRLFDPLGGAVNDMISHDAFDKDIRSNFIPHRVLRELENYLQTEKPFDEKNLNSLIIVLGFLKNSDRLTIARWEYFATTDHWMNSEVFRILRDIFPERILRDTPEWRRLYEFLYPK